MKETAASSATLTAASSPSTPIATHTFFHDEQTRFDIHVCRPRNP